MNLWDEDVYGASFSEWDANDDQQLTYQEFSRGSYDTWDDNDDDNLGRDEFESPFARTYQGWDRNDDNRLDQTEMDRGMDVVRR